MTEELELLEQALSSVEEVCSQLAPEDWDRQTDLPGWTVKDNLAHLASYEAIAAGLVEPASVPVDHLAHVKQGDVFSESNEREVEARRAQPPSAILDEYRQATAARLKHLAALDADGWETDTSTFPWGSVPTKGALALRIFDAYYHEQDIRRATGRPGHLDGAVSRFAFDRLATMALPRIVGKAVGAPEGTTVRWDVAAPHRSFGVAVRDGRGVTEEEIAEPTVRFGSDFETMLCLFGGRWTPERARSEGRLTVEGDEELATAILANITVVP